MAGHFSDKSGVCSSESMQWFHDAVNVPGSFKPFPAPFLAYAVVLLLHRHKMAAPTPSSFLSSFQEERKEKEEEVTPVLRKQQFPWRSPKDLHLRTHH